MSVDGAETDVSNEPWPAHFPGGCPPTDAEPLDREVFYLVSTAPPTRTDFQSALERGAFVSEPRCQRAGLSCAVEPVLLEETRRRVTRLRAHTVASATLTPDHGVHKQTGRDRRHHTMWLRRTALEAAPTLFTAIEVAR